MMLSEQVLATVTPQQDNSMNRLRRAVYIHVSDLTNAYNIAHAKLEEELARVKAEKENPVVPEPRSAYGVPTELDTSEKKRLQPPKGGSNMVV